MTQQPSNTPAQGPETVHCAYCGELNPASRKTCWMCEQDLSSATPVVSHQAGDELDTTVADKATAAVGRVSLTWAVSVALLVVLFAAVSLGIGLSKMPALLIPFVAVSVLVLGALIRMIQLQRRAVYKKSSQESFVDALATVGAGAALGLSAVAVILGLILLLMVAAGIIFFIVCFAMLASYGP